MADESGSFHPRMMSVAYRMLGSMADAEGAPDRVKERLVMADDQQCPNVGAEPGLHCLDRIGVEVVPRQMADWFKGSASEGA